jgi:hypothetical protein
VVEFEEAARLLLSGVVVSPPLGIWPGEWLEDDPKAMGFVGMPVWFWAEEFVPGMGRPVTKTTTLRGYELRATLSFVRMVWDAGDGGVEFCGWGDEPWDRSRVRESPSCGHVYFERGDYVVQATTEMVVVWSSSTGASGRIPLSVEGSGKYHVGEIQVIGTYPRSYPT